MIVIKVFNDNKNENIEYISDSRIDGYPMYKFQILSFNDRYVYDFFTDYSKLILYLRIFKLKQIKKSITEKELIDFNILQYIKNNYNSITTVTQM